MCCAPRMTAIQRDTLTVVVQLHAQNEPAQASKPPGRALTAMEVAAMQHVTEQQLAALKAAHPAFECWIVWPAIGPPIWCARPEGSNHGCETINAGSAEELGAMLALADG
jgi:hypothetical protein